MAGGLGLFLYGMTILSSGLEKASGGLMEKVLAKMTETCSQEYFSVHW